MVLAPAGAVVVDLCRDQILVVPQCPEPQNMHHFVKHDIVEMPGLVIGLSIGDIELHDALHRKIVGCTHYGWPGLPQHAAFAVDVG